MNLFDAAESEARKTAGMSSAEGARAKVLDLARKTARHLASLNGEVTSDDVNDVLSRAYDISPSELGPAAGSVFKGKGWEFTGKRVRSRYVRNHSRELKVWRLK